MAQSKAPLSVPVREAFRTELDRVAVGERKKVSEITGLILEWSVEQLVKVGSVNRLLRCGIHLPDGLPRSLGETSTKR